MSFFAWWQSNKTARPLALITLIALVPRLIAVFFSGGYYAHDDHFLVIEASQSWVDGYDYNRWLPWNQGAAPTPTGHMMVYPGLHYLLFVACEALGITEPGTKMLIVRLLHALWSLVLVRSGYRIALLLADRKIAWRVGLFLGLFFFMPFLSVRNLIEVVSAPLIMLATEQFLRAQRSGSGNRAMALAALFVGLAINIRFQTFLFGAGAGVALLLQQRFRHALIFGGLVFAPLLLLQGTIDTVIWGRPLAELGEYVGYNADNTDTYGNFPWYNHVLVLAALFVPPFSLLVLFGFWRIRRVLVPWLGIVAFVLAHSMLPNKQERFMLPIASTYFVLGYCAWELYRGSSAWWQARPRLYRGIMIWTWSLNTLLLVPLCFSYSKHERIRAMAILRAHAGVTGLIMEDSVESDAPMAPRFYWGMWGNQNDHVLSAAEDYHALLSRYPDSTRANVILFVSGDDLTARVERASAAMGPLHLLGEAHPGLLDRTMHWLNPVNRNMVIHVYGTEAVTRKPAPAR